MKRYGLDAVAAIHRKTLRRRRAQFDHRCVRLWLRQGRHVVRFLWIEDYSQCENGGQPRSFVKLLAHTRYAPGIQCKDVFATFMNTLAPQLVPGAWTEVEIR